MKTTLVLSAVVLGILAFNPHSAMAQHEHHGGHSNHRDHSEHRTAPIGVMGDHLMNAGEWMTSYRYMRMDMDGNRDGSSGIGASTIVTTVPNRFFGIPGQPPTLRVVPTDMQTDMHMFGAMYGVTDWLTVMTMGMYLERDMDHITFAGGVGTTQLGEFTTESEGFGDTRITGLVQVYEDATHRVHLNAGLSLPTGSITEEDTVLAPNGMTPIIRLPYAMQLGSGTFDAMPGITYNGMQDNVFWGAQYVGEIRLEDENDEGYSLGDKHFITAWGGYQRTPSQAYGVETSLRLTGSTQDDISGIDPLIVAPVQTADPNNYGGEMVELGFGASVTGKQGVIEGHRLAAEFTIPLYRDLNGPQLERDYTFTLGWQKAF